MTWTKKGTFDTEAPIDRTMTLEWTAVDNDFDALYHQAVVTDIVESYGWDTYTASESTAMAYSECADTSGDGRVDTIDALIISQMAAATRLANCPAPCKQKQGDILIECRVSGIMQSI